MNRLIQSGLMFGNLIHVASPALVERYNRALRHLTGKTTTLSDFHIDISGFSPEVGDELGDLLYLNHNGVNRKRRPHPIDIFSFGRLTLVGAVRF